MPMRKNLLFFLLFVLGFNTIKAQFDTEHWFAPYFDSSSSSYVHGLYLSTDSTTPFQVRINNNNTVIGTVTISKGSPQVFTIPTALIRTNATADAAQVKTMGLYVVGDQ